MGMFVSLLPGVAPWIRTPTAMRRRSLDGERATVVYRFVSNDRAAAASADVHRSAMSAPYHGQHPHGLQTVPIGGHGRQRTASAAWSAGTGTCGQRAGWSVT